MNRLKAYVSWYNEQLRLKETKRIDKPKDSLIWKDIITGTIYYLENSTAKKISDKGIEYINSLKNADDIYDYLCGKTPTNDKDINLFPQLPYLKTKEECTNAYRICDQVLIRTGILYSIKNGDKSLRRYSLTSGINLYTSKTFIEKDSIDEATKKLVDLIDDVLMGKKVNRDLTESYRFDLVKGGSVKIKQYYLENNKIKDIRGASKVLDDINQIYIPCNIKENYIEECIIYNGGGNILCVLPKGEGKVVSGTIEKIHEEKSITAQSAANYGTYSLFDLSLDNYKNTMSNLQLKVTDRQMSKFDSRIDIKLKDEKIDKSLCDKEFLCTHCNIRRAFYTLNNEGNLCSSCYNKISNGGIETKNHFKESFRKFAKDNSVELNKSIKINNLKDMGSLSFNNSIAVIYGDGNNMGNIVQNIKSLGEMRYFSTKTENVIFKAVYSALSSKLKNDGFEIIAIGGDDIFMIVPGDKALDIGLHLGEKFDELFKNKSEDKFTATMSLGITISHSTTPIQYLFDLAQQLLKNAKKKSKEINGLGTLDIMALETDISVGTSLKYVRKQMNDNDLKFTLRPYTWEQAETIKNSILKLKKSDGRSRAFELRDASYTLNTDECKLFYFYQRTRLEDKSPKVYNAIDYLLKNLSLNFNLKENPPFLMKAEDGVSYSPWLDIVELWDYVQYGKAGE